MNNQYNLYAEQLVATSINNDSNERTSLDLSSDYITNSNSNVHIVNYLIPNSEILQQQQQQQQQHCDNSKQAENFMQSKSQTTHMLHKPGGDIFSSYDLPVLTPLKYVEYNGGTEEQIIMTNDDICDDVNDDVSDCVQDFKEIPMKNVKRSLPHKKRIAKKLNSDQFSIIISSSDDSTIRSECVNVTQNNQFQCNECGLTIIGQLDFYIHLKDHYEGQQEIIKHAKRKRMMDEQMESLNMNQAADEEELAMHQDVEDDPNSVPENLLIETLEDSQDDIKTEEIEPDAFEFSDTEGMEDMEDFRKEVEKVVETMTVADAECMPDATWNYQVSDEIEESHHSNVGIIESFPEKLETICTQQENKDCAIMESEYVNEKYDSNSCVYAENEGDTGGGEINEQQEEAEDEEDDEDNKPLEEVRVMLKKSKREHSEREKTQNDKDEIELNECLKRIHNFKCNDCNKAFNSRTALGYHLKTHNSERRYVCDQCGKKFLTNGALKVHLRLHTDERPYKCSHCSRSFRQFGDMKYHETSIHSNKKDHVCEFCAKAFARKYSLIIHRRIHTGERSYKCTECDKSFRASSYLLNHKRIHTGEKPYSCDFCEKKFRVHGDAKRHMKIHDRVKGTKEKKIITQNTLEPKEENIKETIIIKQEENLSSKNVDNNPILKKGKKVQKRKSVK
ncbi:hypothetical protein PVAND_005560 [Polypedilum vanderplanki]|uniref:C2H2-type domain-containing protein n=1 Tax=Polypedilum vanderplanki TaxID=319348 RepID=A0A9J6C0Z6_POLVA|nr:hypothetical protein PVAND_005560 [Polypedilum vanderplanki]